MIFISIRRKCKRLYLIIDKFIRYFLINIKFFFGDFEVLSNLNIIKVGRLRF